MIGRTLAATGLILALLAQGASGGAPLQSPWPEPRPVAAVAVPALPDAARQAPRPRPATLLAEEGDRLDGTPAVDPVEVAVAVSLAVQTPPPPRPEALMEAAVADTLAGAVAEAVLAGGPPPRPDTLVLAAASVTTAPPRQLSQLIVARSPIPPKRSETERLRNLRQVAAVRSQPSPGAVTGRATGSLCGVSGIEGSRLPRITSNVQACGIAEPVRVTAVNGVRLSQAAVMHCDTARALNKWVREGLRPAVGRVGGGPVELRVAAHYVCRTRNHQRGAPVSEHGKGRAIDISAVTLANGEQMTVLRDWRSARYGQVMRAMYRSACGIFTTTLGPGSDGYHEDHFHFDNAVRRTNRPICR